MNLVRMKVALMSSRDVIHSLAGGMVEGVCDQVRKVTWNEKSNLARGEAVVPHAAFVGKVVDDVGGRTTRLRGDVFHNFILQSC